MSKRINTQTDQILHHSIRLSGGRFMSLLATGIIRQSEWHRLRCIGDTMLNEPDEKREYDDRDLDPDG
jgi:hypothetical protein